MKRLLFAIIFIFFLLGILHPAKNVSYHFYTDYQGHFSTVFPKWYFYQKTFSNQNHVFKAGFFKSPVKGNQFEENLPCFFIRYENGVKFDEKAFAVKLAENKNPLIMTRVCDNVIEAMYFLFGGLLSNDAEKFTKAISSAGRVYAGYEQIVIEKSLQFFRIKDNMTEVFTIDAGFPSRDGMAWIRILIPVSELGAEMTLMSDAIKKAKAEGTPAAWSEFLLSGSALKNMLMTMLSFRYHIGFEYAPDFKPHPPSIILYSLSGVFFAAFILVIERIALLLVNRRWKNEQKRKKQKPEASDPKYPFLPSTYRMIKMNSYHRDLVVSILFIYGTYFFIASFIDWINQGVFWSFGFALFIAGLLYLFLAVRKVVFELIWGLMEIYLYGLWEVRFTVKGIYGRTFTDIVLGNKISFICGYDEIESIKERSYLLIADLSESRRLIYTHDPKHTEEIETGQRTFYSDMDSVISTMMER